MPMNKGYPSFANTNTLYKDYSFLNECKMNVEISIWIYQVLWDFYLTQSIFITHLKYSYASIDTVMDSIISSQHFLCL